MKTKSPKVYTLAQVGKLLGVGDKTIAEYVRAGKIEASEGEHTPGRPGRTPRVVSEAEYNRLKSDGIARHAGGRPAAKKTPAKGKPTPTTAKKTPTTVKKGPTAAKGKAKAAAPATAKKTAKKKR